MTAKHTAPTMREALEKCAAALQTLPKSEKDIIKFTKAWARFGSMSVASILDEANSALSQPDPREPNDTPVTYQWLHTDPVSGNPVWRERQFWNGHSSHESRPLYTAPPAPTGEVERLVKPIIDRIEWNGRLQQWVVRPDLPAGTIKAVRAALKGMGNE